MALSGGGKGIVINVGNEAGGFVGGLFGSAIIARSMAQNAPYSPDGVGRPSGGAIAAGVGVAFTSAVTGTWLAGRAVDVPFWPSIGVALISNVANWATRALFAGINIPEPTPRLAGYATDFAASYVAGRKLLD